MGAASQQAAPIPVRLAARHRLPTYRVAHSPTHCGAGIHLYTLRFVADGDRRNRLLSC